MKKLGKYASLMLMVLFSSILLVACGKAKIESASIKEGTLPTYIYTNDEFDTSDAVAVVKWSNKKTTYVDAKDLTFDMKSLDLSTVGEKELAITYNDFNFTYTFEVRERGQEDTNTKYNVGSVSSGLVTDFLSNSASNKENKSTQFAITNSTTAMVNNIKAGSNNNFDFRMKAFGEVDGTMDYMDNSLLKTNVEVLIKNGTDFSVIGDDVYGNYVEQVNNTSIKFAKGAEGKTFKINVKLTNAKKDNLGFSMVVDVVNGYNVYNAKDLSVFDNTNAENGWTSLKNAWGLSEIDSNSISSIILQDNIFINDNVVPAKNFWTESEVEAKGAEWRNKTNQPIVGSLKDTADSDYGIYVRTLVAGEKFTVYGNYFSIDISDQKDGNGKIIAKGLSRSVIDGDGNGIVTGENKHYITTHTPLFRAKGAVLNADGTRTEVEATQSVNTATISYRDVRFLGNGARSNSPLESGGIILSKTLLCNLEVENTINKDFFISWFTEHGYNRTLPTDVDAYLTKYYPNYTLTGVSAKEKQERLQKYIINDGNLDLNTMHTIKDSKGYNSYNTLLYIWGTPKLIIENSEFLECGGPAIIADHVTGSAPDWSYNYDPTTGEGGLPSNIDIINSNIASHVVGTESWFATFGAESAVSMVKSPNDAYQQAGKPYLGTYGEANNCFNMIALMKWGAKSFAEQAIFTRGSVRIFNNRADYEAFVTTGKLANGSDYYPYDLNADYNTALGGRYVYTQQPALDHFEALASDSRESGRIGSDKNAQSFQMGGQSVNGIFTGKSYNANQPTGTSFADANYLNFMLTNGFGLIVESNPGK